MWVGPARRRGRGLYGAMWKPSWAVHGGLLAQGASSTSQVVEGMGVPGPPEAGSEEGTCPARPGGGSPGPPPAAGPRDLPDALCLCSMTPVHFSAVGLPISQPVSHRQTGSFLPCNGHLRQTSSLPGLSNSMFLFSMIANKLPWPQGIPTWLPERDLGAAGFLMAKGTLRRVCSGDRTL